MTIEELQSILQNGGIVGAGGAGFPTYAKLTDKADTILLNCSECEPLLQLHRQLLEQKTDEILEMFHLIAETVGAKEAVIGIKKSYKTTIGELKGRVDRYPEMRIALLEDAYPAGDEVVLIYEATGKVVRPGGLPIETGVAVFNVETVYNAYRAVKENCPVIDKVVTVVAEVNNPVTVRVPIGTAFEDVVALAGGSKLEDPAYLVGGPMMGFLGKPDQPVTKTTNALILLPKNHTVVMGKQRNVSIDLKRAASVCCQCQTCTDLCPRHNLGHPITPHLFMRAAGNKDFRDVTPFLDTMFCSGCGTCEIYACPQGLAPRTLIGAYKAGLRKNGVKPPQAEAKPVAKQREMRKVPEDRLMARLGLTKYDVDAPLDNEVKAERSVKIMLSQHIGAPAAACVNVGDMVKTGQMIAKPAKGLSVAIHASINGKVVEVTDKYIKIAAGKEDR